MGDRITRNKAADILQVIGGLPRPSDSHLQAQPLSHFFMAECITTLHLLETSLDLRQETKTLDRILQRGVVRQIIECFLQEFLRRSRRHRKTIS